MNPVELAKLEELETWLENHPGPQRVPVVDTLGYQDRKDTPIGTGVLDYFPDALASVARVSKAGNDQHNPGEPLHWAREKSTDEYNTAVRHLMSHGRRDADGTRHTAKAAWRVLALLQKEIEVDGGGL